MGITVLALLLSQVGPMPITKQLGGEGTNRPSLPFFPLAPPRPPGSDLLPTLLAGSGDLALEAKGLRSALKINPRVFDRTAIKGRILAFWTVSLGRFPPLISGSLSVEGAGLFL